MAVSAKDIVSLGRIRNELRFPQDDTDQDEFLNDLLKSAVSYVSADLSVPLLDIQVYEDVFITEQNPVIIQDEFARSLMSIRTQPQDGFDGYFPDLVDAQSYTVEDPLGQTWLDGVIIVKSNWTLSRGYRFFYIRGIPDNALVRYQPLIILIIRSLYNGENLSQPNSAYERMSQKLRNYTANPVGLLTKRA